MPRTNSNIIVVPRRKKRFLTIAANKLSPQNKLITFIGAMFLLSMLVGIIWSAFSKSVLSSYLDYLSQTTITERISSEFAEIVLKAAFPQLTLILLCCIFANSAVGIPFLITITLFRGFYGGVASACIIKALGFKGFLSGIITTSPPLMMCAAALIIVCSSGIKASIAVNNVIVKGKTRNTKEIFEEFYHAVATSLIISVIGCVLEAILIKKFGFLLVL
ncbi:MAG: hypothetical protein RR933_03060 [Oscillospiraceae bacterium]